MKMSIGEKKILFVFGCPNRESTVDRLYQVAHLIPDPAARKAVEALGDALNGRVEFSKIHLKPFSALVLNDVVLIDNAPVTDWNGERLDTVAKARSIVTTFSLKGLRNDGT